MVNCLKHPRVGDNVKSELITSNLTGDRLREQLQLFSDIAHEYDNYKEVGEGWQACDFMCFLFEAASSQANGEWQFP